MYRADTGTTSRNDETPRTLGAQAAWGIPGRLAAFAVAFCGGFRHYGHMAGFEERLNEPANSARPDGPTDLSVAVVSALGGLIAAWVAAGSTGLLAHPLRRAVTLALLAIAILVRRPIGCVRPKTGLAILPLILGVAVFMATLPAPAATATCCSTSGRCRPARSSRARWSG